MKRESGLKILCAAVVAVLVVLVAVAATHPPKKRQYTYSVKVIGTVESCSIVLVTETLSAYTEHREILSVCPKGD